MKVNFLRRVINLQNCLPLFLHLGQFCVLFLSTASAGTLCPVLNLKVPQVQMMYVQELFQLIKTSIPVELFLHDLCISSTF